MTLLHRLNQPNRHPEELEVGSDQAEVHVFGADARDLVGADHALLRHLVADMPFVRSGDLLRRLLFHGDMVRLGRVA